MKYKLELIEMGNNETPMETSNQIIEIEKNMISEGIVWSCDFNGVRHSFKVKGEKHSVSKVTKLASVDVEKLNSIQEFVDYSVTRVRFEQGLKEVFNSPSEMDTKRTGDIIRWVVKDIMDEETDVMVENGLSPQDVNKYISTKVREMFFKELELK